MGNDHSVQPSGTNKSEGTGIPAGKYTDDEKRDDELTNTYTDGGDGLAAQVRTNHPARNVDKEDATNAGGYKN